MAFTYNDDLADVRSRVRSAVGDTVSPGLLPDATYDAVIAQRAGAVEEFDATADDDLLAIDDLADLGWSNGDPIVLAWLEDLAGLSAATVYYIRDLDGDTFALSATFGGAAINITADGSGLAQLVNEEAAIREIARKLAARYASKPTDVRLTSGLSVSWAERVAHWRLVARGADGGSASAGRGFRIRRGAAVDYTAGDGDAA